MLKILEFIKQHWHWLFLLLAMLFFLSAGYRWGSDNVQAKWDADKKAMQIALAEAKAKQAEVTTKVITEYVDRVQVVREKGQTIVKEVPKYVPITTPDLPGGFRVLHDAAVRSELPDPASVVDAAPVAAQDATATVTDNYRVCHENAEQLTALQSWAKQSTGVDGE